MNLLYLGIGINPIGSSKLKLWPFHAKLVGFPGLHYNSSYYYFFRDHNFMFDSRSLYSFKDKVLRVLFQLESPNLEHRNSSYVRNDPDYSMFKTEIRIWLAHGPTLSEFIGHLGSQFCDSYSLIFVLLEVYFT